MWDGWVGVERRENGGGRGGGRRGRMEIRMKVDVVEEKEKKGEER